MCNLMEVGKWGIDLKVFFWHTVRDARQRCRQQRRAKSSNAWEGICGDGVQ